MRRHMPPSMNDTMRSIVSTPGNESRKAGRGIPVIVGNIARSPFPVWGMDMVSMPRNPVVTGLSTARIMDIPAVGVDRQALWPVLNTDAITVHIRLHTELAREDALPGSIAGRRKSIGMLKETINPVLKKDIPGLEKSRPNVIRSWIGGWRIARSLAPGTMDENLSVG